MALVALAFSQAPGKLIGDTKSDLVLDPGAFLRRALEAWDPQQGFGVLAQPVLRLPVADGAVLLARPRSSGVPGWAVQRGWWALLLVVGFTGALRLAGALGIGTPATRLLAALAYALSPRVLSVLGTISVEAWPAAVLPWILLPLVRGADRAAQPASGRGLVRGRRALPRRGERDRVRRRAPAAAALPAHPAGRRPRPAAGLVGARSRCWPRPGGRCRCWCSAGTATTSSTCIETARVTTSVTGLVDTLRGGDHWLGYLVVDGRPVWTAGWELATRPGWSLVTTLVAAAGLAGLLLPGCPERRWLLGGVLLGAVLVSAAHTGVLTGPLAPSLQSALDGGLAPLRNVHKVDPVLRLPLALGLAHLLAVAGTPPPRPAIACRPSAVRRPHVGCRCGRPARSRSRSWPGWSR